MDKDLVRAPSLRESPTPADILNAASELVQAGWIQGAYFTRETPRCYCALGAIEQAALNLTGHAMSREKWLAVNTLAMVTRTKGSTPSHAVVQWNDSATATKLKVVRGLRKAASVAAAQGNRKDGSSHKNTEVQNG